MLKRHLRWLLPAVLLCVAALGAYIHYRPPSRLPNGRAADTRKEFQQRRDLMASFGEPIDKALEYDSTQARELATRESLDAMRQRMANTGVAYEFHWRTHPSAGGVYEAEKHDEKLTPHASQSAFYVRFVRPGVWSAEVLTPTRQLRDIYLIRVATRSNMPKGYWQATANFRLPASLGVAEVVVSCAADMPDGGEGSYGYCEVPAPREAADSEANAALIARLVQLQVDGPSPVMLGAWIDRGAGLEVASGVLVGEKHHDDAQQASQHRALFSREFIEMTQIYGIYAVAGLVLLGMPALALFGAISARRSSGARTGSGVLGVICAGLAVAAAVAVGHVGPWGLMLAVILIVFAISAGLSGLIGLVGAMCGSRD
jgi:hypothetical protein